MSEAAKPKVRYARTRRKPSSATTRPTRVQPCASSTASIHTFQTYDFGVAKRKEYLGLNRMQMGIWEAAEYLNQLVDDSDPDTDMSQLEHLLQTAEHLREDGQPRW
jgi:hypothetical protein